jgi:nucleotide-binding universal stress UspA family protein
MKRILVGMDGTAEARRVADFAATRAHAEGRELVLAHVLPARSDALLFDPEYVAWRAWTRERSAQELEEIAQREARENAQVHTRLLESDDAAGALAKAAQQDPLVELVVVGRRARGTLAGAIAGSVADRLVQICKKPVLVVR